jgi:hypothetical protein
MSDEEREAEILRIARLLASVIGEELLKDQCAGCRAKGERFHLADLDTTKRVIGRLRGHIESASAHMDLAFEEAEILADQFGI